MVPNKCYSLFSTQKQRYLLKSWKVETVTHRTNEGDEEIAITAETVIAKEMVIYRKAWTMTRNSFEK